MNGSVVARLLSVIGGIAIAGGMWWFQDRPNQCVLNAHNRMVSIEREMVQAVNGTPDDPGDLVGPRREAVKELQAIDMEACPSNYRQGWEAHIATLEAVVVAAEQYVSDPTTESVEKLEAARRARVAAIEALNRIADDRSGIDVEVNGS